MGGQQKGGNFERDMCRRLSLWWSDGERDDLLWRNRVKKTSKTPNAQFQLGDITAVDTDILPFVEVFSLECKAGYSQKIKSGTRAKNSPWDLLDVIDGTGKGEKMILKFWNQCIRDAKISQRIPLLIFKRDFHKPVVCIPTREREGIVTYFQYGPYIRLTLYPWHEPYHRLEFHNLEDFLKFMTPEKVRDYHNTMPRPKPKKSRLIK